MSKVFIASDHAGFALKAALVPYIRSLGHEVEDMGAHEFIAGDDYPDYVTPCARAAAARADSFGIIIGKSGQGEAMCANRVPGARAAVFYSSATEVQPWSSKVEPRWREVIRLAREDNNANILSLAAGFLSEEEAKQAVALFLATPFPGDERHTRRLAKF